MKNINEIQRIIRDYFEKVSSNKFENLEEIDKSLDTYDLPNLKEKNIGILKGNLKEMTPSLKFFKPPIKEKPLTGFTAEFYQNSSGLTQMPLKLLHKIER
jgi:hypothetical protein